MVDHADESEARRVLPASPITGETACWLPKVTAAGCLGLTYLGALQNRGLKGSSALAFPLFGRDPKERLFSLYMAGTLTSPLMIWTLEELGARGTPHATDLLGPLVLGTVLQYRGLDETAPLYLLDVVLAIRGDKPAMSSRKVDRDVARAVLPATLVGHVVPSVLMGVLPMTFTDVSRSTVSPQSIVCHAFLYAPLTVPVLTYGLIAVRRWARARANLRAPAAERKAPHEVDESYTVGGKPDTSVLREAYSDLLAVQAAGHVVAVASLAAQGWAYLAELPAPGATTTALAKAQVVLGWLLAPMGFTRFRLLSLSAAATATLGLYAVWDLRRRGYTTSREAKRAAAGFVVGHVLVGPGASYAGLWMWREGVLGALPPGL